MSVESEVLSCDCFALGKKCVASDPFTLEGHNVPRDAALQTLRHWDATERPVTLTQHVTHPVWTGENANRTRPTRARLTRTFC